MNPEKEIDIVELKKLCRLNCTMEEIAAFFDCNKKTIERRMEQDEEFRRAVEDGRSMGRLSMRRKQLELMENGNATMAIWLGKQYLGQSDKISQQMTGLDGGPIQNKWTIEIVDAKPPTA
jgi:hypothetical protein